MNLERAFELSSILLTAIGFAGLAMTTELPLMLALLGLLALTVRLAQSCGWTVNWLTTQLLRLSPALWNSLMVMAFVAFGPMHVAMLASVNNDALAELILAALLLLLTRRLLASGQSTTWNDITLGILLGLARPLLSF